MLGGRVFLCGGEKEGFVASRDLFVFDPAEQQVPSTVDLDDDNL